MSAKVNFFHVIFPNGSATHATSIVDAELIASSIGEPLPFAYIWRVHTDFTGTHFCEFVKQYPPSTNKVKNP